MIGGLRPAVLRMYDPLDTRMVGADPNESMNGLSGRLRGLLSGPSRGGRLRRGASFRARSGTLIECLCESLARACVSDHGVRGQY